MKSNCPFMVNVLLQKLSTEPMFLMMQTPFKERYRNHTRDFKHESYENSTQLNKYIWQLKRSNINFSIKYSRASKWVETPAQLFVNYALQKSSGLSNLLLIKISRIKNLFINKCRHLNKFLLANVKKSIIL